MFLIGSFDPVFSTPNIPFSPIRRPGTTNSPRTASEFVLMKTLNSFSSPMVKTPVVTAFLPAKSTNFKMASFSGSTDLEKATNG